MTANVKIGELVLRSVDAESSRIFLQTNLRSVGATRVATGEASVRFVSGPPAPDQTASGQLDPFWKFSIFCDELDSTRASLVAAGVVVSEPVQFGQIGYLCHFREPGGIEIELVQRTFLDSPQLAASTPDQLGLITLRTADPEAAGQFLEEGLGMRLLATMAVENGPPNPFDLYFYAATTDVGPNADLSSVENREWLYQRSFSIIELQHHRHRVDLAASSAPGLAHLTIDTPDLPALALQLATAGVKAVQREGELRFSSPDGHGFVARQSART